MARKPALESQEVALCMVNVGGLLFRRVERGRVDEAPESSVGACQGDGGRVIKGIEDREKDLVWKM